MASKGDLKILFIGKAGDPWSESAADLTRKHFPGARIVFSRRSDPFPANLLEWEGDLLISYLSQWIIPAALLGKAGIAAINFHPGPPEYPGIGCTNFAIYNGEKEFGVTCHHMQAKVDTGSIIAVRRFPVAADDTVYTVTQNCYRAIGELYREMLTWFITHHSFPVSEENWTRKPFTRKQLNELCLLQPGMSAEEIALRLKATTYGTEIWAQVETGGKIMPYPDALRDGIIGNVVTDRPRASGH